MKDDFDEGGWWIGPLILIVMLSTIVFVFVNISTGFESRYIVIDSEIVDVETIVKENGEIDYLLVTFANNETYKINPDNNVDLTVNSKMIIELKKNYTRRFFWEEFEPTDYPYDISKLIKIPCHLE